MLSALQQDLVTLFFYITYVLKFSLPSHMVIYILQRLCVTLLLKLSKNITFNYYGFYTYIEKRNEVYI